MKRTVKEILEEALETIVTEHGLAINHIDVRWLDFSTASAKTVVLSGTSFTADTADIDDESSS